MVDFTKSKEEFPRVFIELLNEISFEDITNKILTSIDSTQLENCFIEWVMSI